MTSILTSIKKMLGIEETYTHFDVDITIYINSALMVLNQIGVGPDEPFLITSKTETWAGLLGQANVEAVKTYIYLKVRLVFDPPTSSFVLESINKMITELEWRLNVQVEIPIVEAVI